MLLGTELAQANSEFPPLVAHVPTNITLNTVPTPTLPSRLKLFAPAFQIEADSYPVTMTVDTTGLVGNTSRLHLVYQATPQGRWQLVYADHNAHTLQPVRLPGTGTYAWVWLTPAAVPPAPIGALVVDDVAPEFVTYTHSTPQYWHIATTGGDYYGGHTHWTRNTQTATENWATWQPTTPLTGVYTVWVYVPNDYADTEAARYTVSHAGISTTITVNQNAVYPNAAWVQLGTFNFISTTTSYVHLTDMTGEPYDSHWIAFDAVAFVPQIRQVYLPLVLRNWPPPPKLSTGVHLGNRTADWTTEMLQPIDGERGGVWPAAVVVLSDQVWTIERSTTAPCTITQAYARTDRPIVYDYLKRAALNNVRVIVRIYPSPGNFLDWDDPLRQNHHLLFGATPAGENYCYDDQWPKAPDWPYGYQYFRATTDIVAEMGAIHVSNQRDGWSESGFEPANEPNVEWYALDTTDPNIKEYEVWDEMDTYFSTIHQVAHSQYVGDDSFNVFTPPMGQSFFADGIHWTSCEPLVLTDESDGYDHLVNTYGEHNDGYSWHNYWVYGREDYIHCRYGGQHVAYEFPTWVFQNIFYGDRPSQITEVDLASVCQNMGNVIQWKDEAVVSSTQSLSKFFTASFLPDVEIVWLLNDNTGHILQPEQCNGITEERQLREHDWHEAFDEDDRDFPYGEPFRQWFTDWWPIAE